MASTVGNPICTYTHLLCKSQVYIIIPYVRTLMYLWPPPWKILYAYTHIYLCKSHLYITTPHVCPYPVYVCVGMSVSMSMSVCVCMCVCAYVCVCVCFCVWACVCVFVFVCLYRCCSQNSYCHACKWCKDSHTDICVLTLNAHTNIYISTYTRTAVRRFL